MTTPQTAPERLPWWRYLGPWPLRPVAMVVIILLATLLTSAALLTRDNIGQVFLSGLAAGIAGGAVLWLADRYAANLVRRGPGYVVALILTSTVVVLVRWLTGTIIDYPGFDATFDLGLAVVRTSIAAFVILALLGLTSRRLQWQVDRTQEALEIVRAQSSALLEADETIRQQVAAALHDRVQAGIIGACLQLQTLLPRTGTADAELIRRVISSLEELRSLDIRRAVRSLSPNLREIDLQSALEELSETYSPGMTTRLRVSPGHAPYELQLGAYRIVEQSLLNAVMHGRATTCQVDIHTSGTGLEVVVRDNGTGLPAQQRPGLGSTLISTWCRTLDGTWVRHAAADGGTEVRARFPLPVGA